MPFTFDPAAVHDEDAVLDGDGGLGDVRRHHDLPHSLGGHLEYGLLFRRRQGAVERVHPSLFLEGKKKKTATRKGKGRKKETSKRRSPKNEAFCLKLFYIDSINIRPATTAREGVLVVDVITRGFQASGQRQQEEKHEKKGGVLVVDVITHGLQTSCQQQQQRITAKEASFGQANIQQYNIFRPSRQSRSKKRPKAPYRLHRQATSRIIEPSPQFNSRREHAQNKNIGWIRRGVQSSIQR